jgi:16S rRNA (guanine(1405)-N(7))-methyltransferase
MTASEPEDAGGLVAAVRQGAKYRHVSADLVAAIARGELARRGSRAAAIKETRNKLHQAGGAYLGTRVKYGDWLADLSAASRTGDPEEVRNACRRIMRHHASTRERLPILEGFYGRMLAGLPPIKSIVDVACGFNPLAIPWMPLAPEATYLALDIYDDMIDFLNACFPLLGIARGHAQVRDVSRSRIEGHADVALILKALPILEQLQEGTAMTLLRSLDVPYLLVSFPARSLGGRSKGMVRNYGAWFDAAARAEGWSVERVVFPTELAYLVRT